MRITGQQEGIGMAEEEKGYQLVADTRLITPYTSYLLRRFP